MSSCTGKKSVEKEKKIVITFASAEPGIQQIKAMRKIIGAFEKQYPSIKIRLEWGTRPETILTQIAANAAPDVFMWWNGITHLKESGALLSLTPYIKKNHIDLSKYWPSLVNYYTYAGQLYAFPLQMKTDAIVYNKSIFKQYKVAPPKQGWTWDDYYAKAKALTRDTNGDGRKNIYGTLLPPYLNWLLAYGGGLIDPETKKCIIGSPKSRRALEFLLKLYGNVTPTAAEMQAVSGFGGLDAFTLGKVAMLFAPAYMLQGISKTNIDWEVAPLPLPPQGRLTYVFDGAGLLISSQTKHPKEAFLFVSFYAGKIGMDIFASYRNGIPALKESAYTIFAAPPPQNMRYYLEAAKQATVPLVPKIKGWNEILSSFYSELTKLFLGNQSLNITIDNIKKNTDSLLRE